MRIREQLDDHESDSWVTGLECKDKSLTQQSMAEDADINVIARRFGLTGELPQTGSVPLVTNGEFVDILTYQDALDIIIAGRNSFSAMPAEVRSRFENDPAKFVDYCSDPANIDELRKLGLAVPKVADPVLGVPPTQA